MIGLFKRVWLSAFCEVNYMSNKKVSIIVPIHNTPEKELKECLDSLVNQYFFGFEIVCVDDLSTNSMTKNILKQYEEKYSDVIELILLDKNVGAGEARNIGFAHASGEYSIFLDSDDVFSSLFIATLYERACATRADVCLCEYSLFESDNNGRNIIGRVKMNFEYEDICDSQDLLIKIPASGCNRMCRTEYLKENNITFQSLNSDNDLYFALKTILCTRNISIVHDCEMMFYRFNTTFQISANFNPLNMQCAIEKTLNEISEFALYDNAFEMISAYAVVTGLYELRKCKKEENGIEFYNSYKNSFIKNLPIYENSRVNMYLEYWKNNAYESRWFIQIDDFDMQLNNHSFELKSVIDDNDHLFVWGRGKRALAFENWCLINKISIDGICDSAGNNIGEIDQNNNLVVSPEKVLDSRGTIVATNHEIFTFLQNNNRSTRIIDLEKYCPL